MASIRRRGAKWQVQIRPQGHPPVSKTFHKKADAERWTIKTEAAIQRGDPVGEHRDLKQTTMGDLQKRYRETVSPSKRGSDVERLRVRAGINDLHFHDLRHEAISRFFELGLTVPEVASISGHRDVRMRYAHICSTEGIAIKLSAVTSQ